MQQILGRGPVETKTAANVNGSLICVYCGRRGAAASSRRRRVLGEPAGHVRAAAAPCAASAARRRRRYSQPGLPTGHRRRGRTAKAPTTSPFSPLHTAPIIYIMSSQRFAAPPPTVRPWCGRLGQGRGDNRNPGRRCPAAIGAQSLRPRPRIAGVVRVSAPQPVVATPWPAPARSSNELPVASRPGNTNRGTPGRREAPQAKRCARMLPTRVGRAGRCAAPARPVTRG